MASNGVWCAPDWPVRTCGSCGTKTTSTSTIDYCYLLSGEVVLLLDEQEVTIKAGDVVILRNSFHSWRNDGTVPARMTVTLVRVGS